jgi:hypothetical protein
MRDLRRVIPVSSLIILFVFGCSSRAAQPPEWFANSSCEPPCWQQLMPGRTMGAEVLQAISQIAFIDPTTITTNGAPWNGFSNIIYLPLSDRIDINVYLLDDRVSKISFYGGSPGENQLGITIGDVLAKFGEPDSVIRVQYLGRGWLPGSDTLRTFVFILYLEKGIAMGYDETSLPVRQHTHITPEIELARLDYFYPEDFNFLLENGTFSQGNLDAQETLQIMRPWAGYGEYPP